ncbi:hypothetical protein FA13DRAFT_555069 [Coprinellus micaceus]|uniref:Uncharacterized protein n=1 Tax=Coprinellus micaceus TaxID=71717 RepID=A0A4Y7T927_COPMI|nr:hypothetical protein FA13DRAFT_555069 [Coprinellus micaceus]
MAERVHGLRRDGQDIARCPQGRDIVLWRNIVQRLDWDEAHFEEAKALITKYLQDPAGPRLAAGSSNASQRYTDNRRSVSQYQTDFSGFVSNMRDENRQAQIRLQGNIDKLNADIDRYNSAGEQIKRALSQIAGIPSWMTWLIAEILDALGIASVDDARKALDANYAEQRRLRDEIESVQREKERMNQMDADLARANDTLTRLNRGITDLIPGLDSLAKEWANYHHDIVLIQQDMVAAGDSATKRSLITRLKLMGGSVDALVAGMSSYIKIVEGSGFFK